MSSIKHRATYSKTALVVGMTSLVMAMLELAPAVRMNVSLAKLMVTTSMQVPLVTKAMEVAMVMKAMAIMLMAMAMLEKMLSL